MPSSNKLRDLLRSLLIKLVRHAYLWLIILACTGMTCVSTIAERQVIVNGEVDRPKLVSELSDLQGVWGVQGTTIGEFDIGLTYRDPEYDAGEFPSVLTRIGSIRVKMRREGKLTVTASGKAGTWNYEPDELEELLRREDEALDRVEQAILQAVRPKPDDD